MTDTISERVKKLLRLAADKCNRHESEQALRRAFELARKHNIDLESLDLDEQTEAIAHEWFERGKRISYLEYRAANVVIAFFRVSVTFGYGRACFVGKPTDIAIAHYAFEFIVRVGKREQRDYEVAEHKGRRKMSTAKRQNFIQGFIYGLTRQLRIAEVDLCIDAAQEAIVIAEDAQRQAYMDSLIPDAKTLSRDVSKKIKSALMEGFDAGQRTNIRTPLESAPGPATLALE